MTPEERYAEVAARYGSGLGDLLREEGPGASGGPSLLPLAPGLFGETREAMEERLKVSRGEMAQPRKPEQVFDSYQRPDDRVVQFGLQTEFTPEETLAAYDDIMSSMGPVSSLAQKKAVSDIAKQLEALPEDDPMFAPSPLDELSMDIEDTMKLLEKAEQPEIKDTTTALAKLNQEIAEDEMGRGISEQVVEESFMSAMDDFLESARGAGPDMPKERTIDEYKKKFSEATGIDVSGKVDKSQALMAFGLALMQNKAGKGFNVAKMLQSVGTAGESAMPALEKAKDRARQGALAGGKYALEMQSSDQAKRSAAKEKAMDRSKYWVYRKGSEGAEFEGFDQGEFVDLNKFELNELIMNPEFEKQFEFINGADRLSILEKRAEGQDLGDEWDSYSMTSLIGGDPKDVAPELQVLAAPVNANYKGKTATKYKLQETPETVARRFMEYQQSINSGSEKMETLINNLGKGISIPKQILSGMQQALRNFGIDAGSMPSNVADAKRMLNNLAIDEATNILQESGKTLSDNDRKLVKDRIGQINWTSGDVELIKRQLKDIYDLTVVKPQKNLDRAVSWLEDNAGISFNASTNTALKPANQEELDALNEMSGTNYTMDDFK